MVLSRTVRGAKKSSHREICKTPRLPTTDGRVSRDRRAASTVFPERRNPGNRITPRVKYTPNNTHAHTTRTHGVPSAIGLTLFFLPRRFYGVLSYYVRTDMYVRMHVFGFIYGFFFLYLRRLSIFPSGKCVPKVKSRPCA